MIKLIAIDLDDTLLDSSLKISPRAAAAIQKAADAGIIVTIATGRMYQSALPYAKQLGLDVPLITYNGGLIKAAISGETFYHEPVPSDISVKILDMFRRNKWHIQLYIHDDLYVKEMNEKSKQYVKIAGVKAYAMGEELYDIKEAPTKMLAITEPECLPLMTAKLREELGDSIYLASSKPTFLEITHPKVNKGAALEKLAQKLGIEQQEIMAVGDSGNDLPMIQYAGYGVAMGNASEQVKAAAQFITKTCNDDGVAEAIERILL